MTRLEAAELLNVSPEFVDTLLGEGHLASLEDPVVQAYKEKRDKERAEGLAELTRLSQELGLYE